MIDPSLKEQFIKPSELMNMEFNAIITNAYLLKKHFPHVKNIHSHLNFNGVIMTDSGAYQILRYGKIDVSNKEIIEYQCFIGSDIGVILDIPTRFDVSKEEAYNSARETLNRAKEALSIISGEACRNTLWTLPIQGGIYLDVLSESAAKSVDLFYQGFSIFALGSPTTLLEQYLFDKVIDMIFTVRSKLPFAAPLHLFGAGHPLILPFAVALGVDLFDSASYILYAKDNRYITRRGTYRLEELDYAPCQCPICSKHSPKELLEMTKNERIRLLAMHNLYVIKEEINEIKQAIKEGRFWEYLEFKANAHPSTKKAFTTILKYVEYLYKHSPLSKPNARAVLILSEYSIFNPRIVHAKRKMLSEGIHSNKDVLIFLPYIFKEKYEVRDLIKSLTKEIDMNTQKIGVYLYYPVIGAVPWELRHVYPYSQFELSLDKLTENIVIDLAHHIFKIIMMSKNASIIYLVSSGEEWQEELYKKIVKLVENSGKRSSIKFLLFDKQ